MLFQTFHRRFLFLIFTIFILSYQVHASNEKTKPLPPVDEVDSSMASVDKAIPRMWVSENFPVSESLKNRLFSNADLIQIEVDAIRNFINDIDTKNYEKRIIIGRYKMGDSRYTEVIQEALQAGIEVQIILDMNPILSSSFRSKEKFHSRFKESNFKDSLSEGAINLQTLLDSGMEIFKDIFSQPLYNTKEVKRLPVLHDKFLILMKNKKMISQGNIRVFFGTSNTVTEKRYNRVLEVVDVVLCKVFVSHAENLIKTYKLGRPTSETETMNRVKVNYKDGTSVEFAATDGKFNPNDRIGKFLNSNSDKIKKILFSQFIITHRDVLKELKEVLSKSSKTRVTIFADDRFSELDKWHLPAILEEINIWTLFDSQIFKFPIEFARRIETFIYQKDDGAGNREFLHDKLSMIELDDGTIAAFIGSFNLSRGACNSEVQTKILADINSELIQSFEESVIEFMNNKENQEWVVDGITAVLRNALGMVFGMRGLEVPLESAQTIVDAIKEQNPTTIISELNNISDNLDEDKGVALRKNKNRNKTFLKFLEWYYKNPSLSKLKDSEELRIRRFIGTALIIGKSDLKTVSKKKILKSILHRPGMSQKTQDKLIKQAEKII